VRWYRLAAEQGYGPAQNNLGRIYVDGWGVPQDYLEAVKWLRRAADQGIAKSQLLCAAGNGVPQDFSTAYMWFSLAAAAPPAGELRDKAVFYRDSLLNRMSAAQIGEAQRLAREWKPVLEFHPGSSDRGAQERR
jgi:uncharacterized protein